MRPRKAEKAPPSLFYLPPGSMTVESAVPATEDQIFEGLSLFTVSVVGYTIGSLTHATDREIREARKNIRKKRPLRT